MRRLLLVVAATALLAPAAARAAEPVLPLSDVRAGQRCVGLSVIQGTEISRFDVEVLDVLDGQQPTARVLVRVSGPAIDRTGIGPGFSGSPIHCTGADGVTRVLGAISETIGEYGGFTVLATPIQAMLAQPIIPPGPAAAGGAARPGPDARARFPRARTLAAPLTLSGVQPRLGAALSAAARRAKRPLIVSPGRAQATGPSQPLVPGSAVSAGISSGALALGSAGTVTYVSGTDTWLFGHQLDGVGRRSLLLQGARVSTVVNQPLAVPDATTYKLAIPTADLGTITGDGPTAVTGRFGALPRIYPIRVTAKDVDTGARRSLQVNVADEADLGWPATDPLGLLAGTATAQSVIDVLGGGPPRQRGDMCMQVTLRELKKPLRFCNRYAVDGTAANGLAGVALADVAGGAALLGAYRFGTLHPTAVDIGIRVRRGLRQAYLVSATAPPRVRRGRRVPVRLRLRQVGTGTVTTRTVRILVPADAPKGTRTMTLEGTAADAGRDLSGEGGEDLVVLFEEEDPDEAAAASGPGSLSELRTDFTGLGRRMGLKARFGAKDSARQVFEDPNLRISGSARVRLVVR